MTPQSRMLMILGAFGLGGALALMGIANRYSKMFEERADRSPRPAAVASQGWSRGAGKSAPPAGDPGAPASDAAIANAVRRVDAFVEVRRLLGEAIARDMPPAPEMGEAERAALLDLRRRTTQRVGLSDDDYEQVRNRFREPAASAPGDPLTAALELRARQLARVDLGDYESLDP